MGQEWDGGDIAFRQETWKLALKLLKPGGHLLAFSASRNYHRMAVAIEDAGFEIRDQLMWLYGSGFPKSHDVSKSIDKFERGYRKGKSDPQSPLHKKYKHKKVGGNTKNDLGGYMKSLGNSDQNYIPKTPDTIKWEGWGTALKPAHEPIVMARKPISEKSIAENVLKHGTGGINIDGCRIPHVAVADGNLALNPHLRESISGGNGGKIISTETERRLVIPHEKGRFPANVMHDGLQEDWARYFYCPKVSKSERGKDNTHPTVKPQELMKYLCRLVTPKGGTVLDPFMGSGSTGMAAKDEGFEFIGIEREKEYFEIAEKRINAASPLMEFM